MTPELASSPTLVVTRAMRARASPRAIAGFWAFDAALGAALALPFTSIARGAYGAHPRADAVLWDPGGLPLLDLLVRTAPMAGALLAHAFVVIVLSLALGLLPLAAMLVAIAFRRRDARPLSLRETLAQALPAFGPFAILLAVTITLQVSLVAAAFTAAALAYEGLPPRFGELVAEGAAGGLFAAGALAALLAGVVQDCARAVIVRFGVDANAGLRAALRLAARAPWPIFVAWAWRALASLVPVAFGALLAGKVGGRGGASLVALFAVHQLVVATRVALRASWLASAMRLVDATLTPRG